MKADSSKKLLYTGPRWEEKKKALEANDTFRNLREHWDSFADPVQRAEKVAKVFREVPGLSCRFLAHELNGKDDKTVESDLKVAALDADGKRAIRGGMSVSLAVKYFKPVPRTAAPAPVDPQLIEVDSSDGQPSTEPAKRKWVNEFLESRRLPDFFG